MTCVAANETGGASRGSILAASRWQSQENIQPLFEEAAYVDGGPQTAWRELFNKGNVERDKKTITDQWWLPAMVVGASRFAMGIDMPVPQHGHGKATIEALHQTPSEPAGYRYREEQFRRALRENFDVVFDLIGGDAQKKKGAVVPPS